MLLLYRILAKVTVIRIEHRLPVFFELLLTLQWRHRELLALQLVLDLWQAAVQVETNATHFVVGDRRLLQIELLPLADCLTLHALL